MLRLMLMSEGINTHIETQRGGLELPSPAESALDKLRPFEIIDQDGAKRQVFTFHTQTDNDVQVIFYGREDLPFNADVLQKKQGFIFGEAPKFRDIQDWKRFVEDVTKHSANGKFIDPLNIDSSHRRQSVGENTAVYFVENTPKHLLDLAFTLGLEGSAWRNARQKAAQGIYTPEVTQLIDDLIASTIVDDQGSIHKRDNQNGEALVLLQLLGDKEAEAVVDQRRQVIQTRDQQTAKEIQQYCEKAYLTRSAEGWRLPHQLPIATHTTKYKPRVTPDGVGIRSTFDATGGEILRNTIHFSLDGAIDDRMGGVGWSSMDYVISGNLADIRDRNGNPRRMGEVDTYFTVSPGEMLIIPNAHLTMPSFSLPEGVIRQEQGNTTLYKKGSLSPKDLDALFGQYYDGRERSLEIPVSQEIIEAFSFCFRHKLDVAEMQLPENQRSDYRTTQSNLLSTFYRSLNPVKVIKSLREKGITETVDEALHENYPGEVTADDIQTIGRQINVWLVSKIRNGHFGQNLGSGESSTESQQTALLAFSWGAIGETSRQVHFSDPEGLGTEMGRAYGVFDQITRQRIHREQIRQEQADKNNQYDNWEFFASRVDIAPPGGFKFISIDDRQAIMSEMRERRGMLSGDPKTRRMHFIAGII